MEDEVCLTVKDNGVGIPADKLDYIFGLFKRLEQDSVGKGLGLYIVKSQVESLGGRIEVESDGETGTTFHVYLKEK